MSKATELLEKIRELKEENTDNDKAEFQKYLDDFEKELSKKGFDKNIKMEPRYSLPVGNFSIDISSIKYPETSVTVYKKGWSVSISLTQGKMRGGLVMDRGEFRSRKLKNVPKMLKHVLDFVKEKI